MSENSSNNIIEMKNIIKKFYVGKPNELEILHGIDLCVPEGQFVSIVGASGAGKSTLMNIIGALDRATSGSYCLGGTAIEDCRDSELSTIRNRKIGFVFQNFNLLPRMDALRNVELPMMYSGMSKKERSERAAELLEMVGMQDRMDHRSNELSGGQMQRVAIARSMANDPDIILADEPTGALDSRTGIMVMDIFRTLNQDQGKTIVLITHNENLAKKTDRILTMADGYFESDSAGQTDDASRRI